MNTASKFAAAGVAALTGLTLAGAVQAAGHPRVREVNARLENQHDRIAAGVKDSQLNPAEAKSLRTQDRYIHGEEKTMRSLDGGHLTAADQKSLNQQENAVSKQIYTDRHD